MKSSALSRLIPLAEVVVFYWLVLFLIWVPKYFQPPVLLAALIMVGICIASNYYHHDSQERIGLSRRKFWPAMRLSAPWMVIGFVLLLVALPIRSFPPGWNVWFNLFGYPVWGFAQEYVLLGFIANRLEDSFPTKKHLVPWLNGFLFALVHVPNPILMIVTFVSGTLFTFLFFKERHLVPPALVHAVYGVAISLWGGHIPGIMSVGPGYLKRIINL